MYYTVEAGRAEFVANLKTDPHIACDFKVGDKVTFTNEYGVVFPNHVVVGFANHEQMLNGRFIFIDSDAYWFPKNPDQLKKSYT
jgi:hypothetical protein